MQPNQLDIVDRRRRFNNPEKWDFSSYKRMSVTKGVRTLLVNYWADQCRVNLSVFCDKAEFLSLCLKHLMGRVSRAEKGGLHTETICSSHGLTGYSNSDNVFETTCFFFIPHDEENKPLNLATKQSLISALAEFHRFNVTD